MENKYVLEINSISEVPGWDVPLEDPSFDKSQGYCENFLVFFRAKGLGIYQDIATIEISNKGSMCVYVEELTVVKNHLYTPQDIEILAWAELPDRMFLNNAIA